MLHFVISLYLVGLLVSESKHTSPHIIQLNLKSKALDLCLLTDGALVDLPWRLCLLRKREICSCDMFLFLCMVACQFALSEGGKSYQCEQGFEFYFDRKEEF